MNSKTNKPSRHHLGSALVTGRELRDDVSQSFVSIWLTVLSIVQGVALSLLAVRIVDPVSVAKPALTVLYVAFHFMILLGVWNSYYVGALLRRWTPTMWDPVIPFGIGLCEATTILAFRSYQDIWYGGIVVLCAFGVAGHINELVKCKLLGTIMKSEKPARNTVIRQAAELAAMGLAFAVAGYSFRHSDKMLVASLIVGILFILCYIWGLQREWHFYSVGADSDDVLSKN